jgi:antitoxin CptB
MTETREYRLKRLKMRSMRRGIKEMDLILTAYADSNLVRMDDSALQLYDCLLEENDQDLYQWVTGQVETPVQYSELLADISQAIKNNH